MDSNHLFLFLFLSFFLVTPSHCQLEEDANYFVNCSRPYDCGDIKNISYPFWGGPRPEFCGRGGHGYELKCFDNPEFPFLEFEELQFRVLNINQSNLTMTIARMDLWDNLCPPPKFINTTLNFTSLDYAPNLRNLTLHYGCRSDQLNASVPINFTCGNTTTAFYHVDGDSIDDERISLQYLTECQSSFRVPIFNNVLHERGAGAVELQEALNKGFDVEYNSMPYVCKKCEESGGKCGSNSTHLFLCFCQNSTQEFVCARPPGPPVHGKTNVLLKIVIGVGSAIAGVVVMCIIFFIYQRNNKNKYAPSLIVSKNISSHTSSSMTDPERGSIYFGVHLFTYTELEEATNNFDSAKEVGDGGFGTVYYGKLRDGRAVAVKRLYENNCRRVEQFMNEIEILTRLRHRNLVSLYGCTSRHSRELLLVYEYIPNGTVADHLHGERAKPGALPWATRMNIAIETASALAYLHASDTIHRDVKTTNILLDNNYSVKVADFGLSRLFPTDVTHVSTAPQGTPGYVDPEYHECYQLTDKSDVYSFGVVLIELISSKPAVDITRHRHEINLSNMAINKIQNHALHELVDPCIGFESDSSLRKMIICVAELAFQCLQSVKDVRPTMLEVLDELKGILSVNCKTDKAEELDISDDAVLLKSALTPLSPDSALNWISSTPTTSNGSS